HPQTLDRPGSAVRRTLGIRQTEAYAAAGREGSRLAAQRNRSLRTGPTGEAAIEAGGGGGPLRAVAPPQSRSTRPAAQPRRNRGVPARSLGRCLRESRR